MDKKRILAFGASTSRKSINKQFATYTAKRLTELDFDTTLIDLNDFPMPLFSVDLEAEEGAPSTVFKLKTLISQHDGLVISFAEHNGSYTAAFKNAFDWLSRLEGKVWAGKPALLLSTSPGARGGASVMAIAKARFPFSGGEVVATFSLPQFKVNFNPETGIKEPSLAKGYEEVLHLFVDKVSQ
jgi:chromate reductase, NAD(P)H dehydrogenase (quinone)